MGKVWSTSVRNERHFCIVLDLMDDARGNVHAIAGAEPVCSSLNEHAGGALHHGDGLTEFMKVPGQASAGREGRGSG